MKIHPVGADLFHADRRMDRRDETVTFRSFANEPNVEFLRHFLHFMRLT